MTRKEIREKALFFMGAEIVDAEEYAPHLDDAIFEAYGLLRTAAGETWPEEMTDADTPNLPAWAQSALADFAAYEMLRDGGADRRQRGLAHYARFHEAVSRMRMREDEKVHFTHIYD